MRRPIARDQNQRKRATGNPVSNWGQPVVSSWLNFTPLSLQPALWLDASDTTTITESGGAVSQWNDKSGNSRNFTQAVGISQPTTGTRTLNGLNVLDFDGSNHFLDGGNILEVGSGGVTMIGVLKMDVDNVTAGFWGKSRAATQSGRYSFLYNTTDRFTSLWQDTQNRLAFFDPGAGLRTLDYVWALRIARGSTNTLWRNGLIVQTDATLGGTTSYTTNNVWLIGAYQNSTGTGPLAGTYLNGYIGEILVFMRDLTNQELLTVNGYLQRKWAIV